MNRTRNASFAKPLLIRLLAIALAAGIGAACSKEEPAPANPNPPTAKCEVMGRWVHPLGNTLYEFTDSLRYTIYATTPGEFGTIEDAIPEQNLWWLEGDTLVIDLNFGHVFRAGVAFDCDCGVMDLTIPSGTTTTYTQEGFDITTCR